jgi:PKD repeat protein
VFSYSPTQPSANQNIFFDARASTATPPGRAITAYAWSFGDGSFLAPSAGYSYVPKQYTAAGTYVVTLTVYDDQGKTGSSSQNVVVK